MNEEYKGNDARAIWKLMHLLWLFGINGSFDEANEGTFVR